MLRVKFEFVAPTFRVLLHERPTPRSQGCEGCARPHCLGHRCERQVPWEQWDLLALPLLNAAERLRNAPVRFLYQSDTAPHQMLVDVDLKEANPMDGRNIETVGVRRTGWAALDRDPQEDK